MQWNITGLVFDMDGVLFDSESLVIASWKTVAARHDIKKIEETCRRCLGSNAPASRRIFLTSYGEEFPYEAYHTEMFQTYQKAVEEGQLAMKPGVVEILSYCQKSGIPTALASSTNTRVVLHQLELFQIDRYFQKVIGGDAVTHSKPHPEIYQKALAALRSDPAKTVAIEDSYTGIRSAHAAGMQVVMIPDLLPPTPEITSLTVGVFDTLLAFLADIQNKE